MQHAISGKAILVTGGTGSFGSTVTRFALANDAAEIRIFSRDEKKQDDMRRELGDPRVKYYIGDVRDPVAIGHAASGVNYIFHAAALKQVPSCEFHPVEAVKTNILGTENVLNAAIQASVERVVCLSTDKAVYPINAMGMSKALMEKVMVARARHAHPHTIISGTRYGNVMALRGSVIPLFVEQVSAGRPITVTDPNMTRFMMSLDSAVELVMFAFANGRGGDIYVQKSPSVTIEVLADAIRQLMGRPEHRIVSIGTRHGEKLFETLLSREEMAIAEDMGDYYRISSDDRDLNYEKYYDEGRERITSEHDYNSHNAKLLDLDQTKDLLRRLPFMQPCLKD